MKYFFRNIFVCVLLALCLLSGCNSGEKTTIQHSENSSEFYNNPLLPMGWEVSAKYYDGMYYYTCGLSDRIEVWRTSDITDLENAEHKVVWTPKEANNAHHLWKPDIVRINDKWYIYFAADDGNTDNHQIYVIENDSEDIFGGEFKMKGRVVTDKNNNWAIHASVFEHKGEWYMIWSGWQTRRIETETQCIYIAKMKNPWTLSSDRILISKPEYEWERQWINPDGSRMSYPIYVNEGPRYFHTKDKDKVLIYYSASGTWTPYFCVGMLYAEAASDLLEPASWSKSQDPVFSHSAENNVYATGNISFIPSPDGTETYFVYQASASINALNMDQRSPRMQKVEWDKDGFPVLGIPLSESAEIIKPSGSK